MMKFPIQNDYLHSNKARFVHPLAPIADELRWLVGDVLRLLKAAMLGVLIRNTQRVISPTGQYKFFCGAFDHCREVSHRLRAARCEVVD